MKRKLWDTEIELPCFVAPTTFGNAPYLMPDVSDLIQDMQALVVPLDQIHASGNVLQANQLSLGTFLNQSNRLLVLSPNETTINGTNASEYKTIITTNGRKAVSLKEYMEIVNVAAPECFISMADTVNASCGLKRQRKAVETTLKWLKESLELKPAGSKVCATLVGGKDLKLRQYCAEQVCQETGIDAVVVSGLDTCSTEERTQLLLDTLAPVPANLPRILHNVSTPFEVLEAISCGIDVFTGTYPMTVTKFGYALTFWVHDQLYPFLSDESLSFAPGDRTKISLRDKRFANDSKPILEGCVCYACKNHSRAYINHLLNTHEMLADTLLYLHNIHHYLAFFRIIRARVAENDFENFKKAFRVKNTSN